MLEIVQVATFVPVHASHTVPFKTYPAAQVVQVVAFGQSEQPVIQVTHIAAGRAKTEPVGGVTHV